MLVLLCVNVHLLAKYGYFITQNENIKIIIIAVRYWSRFSGKFLPYTSQEINLFTCWIIHIETCLDANGVGDSTYSRHLTIIYT